MKIKHFLNFMQKSEYKEYLNQSFSQEGEDLILNDLFRDRKKGFYIDVGAYHPWKISNTALFYKKGWRGLNVDLKPGFKALFDQQRPNDLNIECAVGKRKKSLKIFLFEEEALNTTCKKRAVFLQKNSSYRLKGVIYASSRTLASLLDEFGVDSIDFLNVDVEGAEVDVLQSGNWEKYRPTYIILEVLDTPIQHLGKNLCIKFMRQQGYEVLTKGFRSVILKDRR